MLAHVPRKAIFEGLAYIASGAAVIAGELYALDHASGGARITWIAVFAATCAAAMIAAHLYYPTFDLAGRCFHRAPGGAHKIAVTFDDGPSEHTPAILDSLKAAGAHATFFWVGERVRERPELVRRALAEGHVIGNHTAAHRKLALAPAEEVEAQVAGAQDALRAAGAEPTLFRAPHGFKSLYLGKTLRRHGLSLIGWTRGIWDTDNPGAEVISRRALVNMRDGEVLLLHDGGGDRSQTAAALPDILEGARARGFAAVTIPELAAVGSADRSRLVAAVLAVVGIALVAAVAL